jgi:hypothetical protein
LQADAIPLHGHSASITLLFVTFGIIISRASSPACELCRDILQGIFSSSVILKILVC